MQRFQTARRLVGAMHVLAWSTSLLALVGCVSPHLAGRPDGKSGATVAVLTADTFFPPLIVVRNAAPPLSAFGDILAIFIEGDGRAWATATSAAMDPTPRRAPMLELMRSTPLDAVYLGRPCYWTGTFVAPCAPKYWTSHRFSDEVVTAMTHAVRQLRGDVDRPLLLVGHSGGGTLAVLVAARLSGEVSVVTFGAVLDHEAWTTRHRVSTLSGSLNPARLAADMGNFSELHVFASRDETVRVADNQRYLNARGGRPHTIIDGDHLCCWAAWWQTQRVTTFSGVRDKHEEFRGEQ